MKTIIDDWAEMYADITCECAAKGYLEGINNLLENLRTSNNEEYKNAEKIIQKFIREETYPLSKD